MVHYSDQSTPPPPPPLAGLAMELSSPCLSSFACLTIHMSHTGRQKKMQTCQNHRGKAKRKHTGAERRYQADAAIFKADDPHSSLFFLFFFHCQARVAGELQIHIRSAALGGCYKLFVSVLTLIGANEQHSHVLSKDPQTGSGEKGGDQFFTQLLQFSTREQMLHSLK